MFESKLAVLFLDVFDCGITRQLERRVVVDLDVGLDHDERIMGRQVKAMVIDGAGLNVDREDDVDGKECMHASGSCVLNNYPLLIQSRSDMNK